MFFPQEIDQYKQVLSNESECVDVSEFIEDKKEFNIPNVDDWPKYINGFLKYFYTHDDKDDFIECLNKIGNINYLFGGLVYKHLNIHFSSELIKKICDDYDSSMMVRSLKALTAGEYSIKQIYSNIDTDMSYIQDIEEFIKNPIIPKTIVGQAYLGNDICRYLKRNQFRGISQIAKLLYDIRIGGEILYCIVVAAIIKNEHESKLQFKIEKEWVNKFYKYQAYQYVDISTSCSIFIKNNDQELDTEISKMLQKLSQIVEFTGKLKIVLKEFLKSYEYYQYAYGKFLIDSDVFNESNFSVITISFGSGKVTKNGSNITLSDALCRLYVPTEKTKTELQKLLQE